MAVGNIITVNDISLMLYEVCVLYAVQDFVCLDFIGTPFYINMPQY